MKRLAVLLLGALVAAGFMGCSKSNPTQTVTVHDTTTVAKFIVADIYYYEHGGSYLFEEPISVFADPAADVNQSSAYLKFGNTMIQPRFKYQLPGEVGWDDTLMFPYPGVPCSLYVNTNIGNSRSGGVSMPDTYGVTTPAMYDTLPWGNVTIAWTQAQYATWYSVSVQYYAFNGSNFIGLGDTFFTLTGTTATIPQAYFRKYGSATHDIVNASVAAHNGATPGAGGAGNMTGDIPGIFYSIHEAYHSYAYFYLGSPKLSSGASFPPGTSRAKRRECLRRAFGARARASD